MSAKIVSIVPYKFLPVSNGGHLCIVSTETLLSKYNTLHTFATVDNDKKGKFPFSLHYIISARRLRYIPFYQYAKIKKEMNKVRPDFIVIHHHYMFLTAWRLALKFKIPLYIRSHNIESNRFKETGKWWWFLMPNYEKFAYKKADLVFYITNDDKKFAIKKFKVKEEKSKIMPVGVEFSRTPTSYPNAKVNIAKSNQLNEHIPWLFFMGQLDYEPNETAVKNIINYIYPALKRKKFSFQILIVGKNLSPAIQDKIKSIPEMKYLGFVDDIQELISACDIMMNPVLGGGGIKTKVIESLAWSKTVVSTDKGAIGVEQEVCGPKLLIAEDYDWEGFADLIISGLDSTKEEIPSSFFDFYNNQKIAARIQKHFEV